MRTYEERLEAMHHRAEELSQQRQLHRTRLFQAGAAGTGVALSVLFAILIPGLLRGFSVGGGQMGMVGGIFSGGGALGYIVIGAVSFLLGVAVTLFCFYRQKLRHKKRGEGGQ